MGFELNGSNLDEAFLAFIPGPGIRGYWKIFGTCFSWHVELLSRKFVNVINMKFLFWTQIHPVR
jgi:hypothetical protein